MALLSTTLQERLRSYRISLLRGRGLVGGSRRTKRPGKSLEWSDFRSYSSGDEFKRVDFKAYARLKKLYVKVYEEEEEGNFVVIMDRSLSMNYGDPNKLQWAKKVTALLAFTILNQGERLIFFPLPLENEKPLLLNNRSMYSYFEDHLIKLQPIGKFPPDDEFKSIMENLPFKGGVFLLSDFYLEHELYSYLLSLKQHSLALTLLNLLSPQELEPEETGEVQLEDLEMGAKLTYLFYKDSIKAYQERLNLFIKKCGNETAKLGGKYLTLRSDLTEDNLILTLLKSRILV